MQFFSVVSVATALTVSAAQAQTIGFVEAPLPASGAVAVAVGDDGLSGPAAALDAQLSGAFARALAAADFKGKADESLTLFGVGPFSRIVAIGVGDGLSTAADLEDFGARAAIAASTGAPETIRVFTPDIAEVARDSSIAARGAALGAYAFGEALDRAKPATDRGLAFASPDPTGDAAAFDRDGKALAAGVILARDLISEPSNIKTPQWFVDRTRAAFQGVGNVSIEVLDERAMQRLGMGLMLGVGQGSTRPPRLLAVRYNGASRTDAPIAFVGKGITFDSGGLSLKDPDGMWRMRYDMSGAAASVGAVLTLAKRGARVNAVGVAALAENMPDGGAIRPGDVLTSYSGKTTEVLNTDAEGRLVLADALAWVQDKHKPRSVITIATLTGAVRTALGDDYAGLFGNDPALQDQIVRAGDTANEPVWRLPIHESLVKDLDSEVADVKNVVEGTGNPGASIGAAYIREWVVKDQAWAHLDIAGMAWKTTRTPTVPAGAVGFGVRLFDQLVRDTFEGK